MAAVLFGFEDLLYSWDSLVWSLTSRALRTCRFGNLRVLQLMLKPWCISRDVYQVGKQNTRPDPQTPRLQGGDLLGASQGPVLFLPTTLGPTQAVGRRGCCGQGRCGRRNILVWRMVMGSPMVGHRFKLYFPQSRGE